MPISRFSALCERECVLCVSSYVDNIQLYVSTYSGFLQASPFRYRYLPLPTVTVDVSSSVSFLVCTGLGLCVFLGL